MRWRHPARRQAEAGDRAQRVDARLPVHVGNARLKTRRLSLARAGYSCGLALLIFLFGSKALQNAVAEGDTRTISMHHIHTDEAVTITYKRDGRYDEAALEKLNWFLRDWRRSEQTRMDPHLIDLVWEVQREVGTTGPVQVVCGYRSPQTNAMLRHRSSGVARFSQHMLGRAMDFYIPGVPLEQLRVIGLRLQRGGVGFYPESGSPFVHMDTGGVRMWPRMSREQLVRVFPDGRTVHIPTDGRPLPGYALALADIRKRGAIPSDNSIEAARNAGVDVNTLSASNERPGANSFAKLLALAKDNDDEDADAATIAAASSAAAPVAALVRLQPKPVVVAVLARGAESKPAPASAAAAAAKVASATAKLKLIHIAKLLAPPAAAVAPTPAVDGAKATMTPNQVIVARGYWQGPPDAMIAANPLAAPLHQHRTEVASADPGITGSIGPFGSASDDPAAPEAALAYAEQPGPDLAAPATPPGVAVLRAAAIAAGSAPLAAANGTTIAVKRAANQVASAIMTASASSVTVIKSGAHVENPWLRAIVLSPSVHRFLTTVALGVRDFRSLASLMVKPKNSVMMTFAADPNPGLQHDHFSGAAIVFVSTVTYAMRTAELQ
jgi:uncharacterized protein YcbK (DUF882 family)